MAAGKIITESRGTHTQPSLDCKVGRAGLGWRVTFLAVMCIQALWDEWQLVDERVDPGGSRVTPDPKQPLRALSAGCRGGSRVQGILSDIARRIFSLGRESALLKNPWRRCRKSAVDSAGWLVTQEPHCSEKSNLSPSRDGEPFGT